MCPNLDHGMLEVRTGFSIPKAGVEDVDGEALAGLKRIAKQALMLPDLLEYLFGWRLTLGVPDGGYRLELLTPLAIKFLG